MTEVESDLRGLAVSLLLVQMSMFRNGTKRFQRDIKTIPDCTFDVLVQTDFKGEHIRGIVREEIFSSCETDSTPAATM